MSTRPSDDLMQRFGALSRGALYVLLFVVGLEAGTRLEDRVRYGAPLLGAYSFDQLTMVVDGHSSNRPGATYRHWKINAQGFRGEDCSPLKPPGVVRVAIAGASEVFGLYESPGSDLSAQLQRHLERLAPRRFEIVNVATPGMTPPRIAELVEGRLSSLAVDWVVVYPAPALYLDDSTPRPRGTRPSVGRTADTGRAPRLRLPERTWTAAKGALPAVAQAWLKSYGIKRTRAQHQRGWVWQHVPSERVELFEEQMKDLLDVISKSGLRVLLATHASRFGGLPVDHDDSALLGWVRFYPRATGMAILEMEAAGNAAIKSLASERGLAVADVATRVGGSSSNFSDFSHFTDQGAARTAEVIAETLLERSGEAALSDR